MFSTKRTVLALPSGIACTVPKRGSPVQKLLLQILQHRLRCLHPVDPQQRDGSVIAAADGATERRLA
ncbi:hypothetical protein ACFQU2_05650 [Siccirubricoccus deserti]